MTTREEKVSDDVRHLLVQLRSLPLDRDWVGASCLGHRVSTSDDCWEGDWVGVLFAIFGCPVASGTFCIGPIKARMLPPYCPCGPDGGEYSGLDPILAGAGGEISPG